MEVLNYFLSVFPLEQKGEPRDRVMEYFRDSLGSNELFVTIYSSMIINQSICRSQASAVMAYH